jgi:hypothetical protein
MSFQEFPKIPRLRKGMVVTEKIDGSNAQVFVIKKSDHPDNSGFDVQQIVYEDDEFAIWAGSRNRWVTPGKNTDNAGFAAWVAENGAELVKLGHGRHFGEWWGRGIQRGYGQQERHFSLFAVHRWYSSSNQLAGTYWDEAEKAERLPPNPPACCRVVPVIFSGGFSISGVEHSMDLLRQSGSFAAGGFGDPEGVIVYHEAAKQYFKHLFDPTPKSAKG